MLDWTLRFANVRRCSPNAVNVTNFMNSSADASAENAWFLNARSPWSHCAAGACSTDGCAIWMRFRAMHSHALISLGSGLIICILVNCGSPAYAADEMVRRASQLYGSGAPAAEIPKLTAGEPGLRAIRAPVLNTIAPERTNVLPAIGWSDRRGAIEQILQSHELSFRTSRSRTLGLTDAQSASSGVDLDSIKVRISRNKFLVRAQFTFN